MYYSKESKSLGFIVYSRYGAQSHVVMNNNGVVFSCNPRLDEFNRAIIYPDAETAKKYKGEFWDTVADVVLITKYEKG